jgi:hypothetical protein
MKPTPEDVAKARKVWQAMYNARDEDDIQLIAQAIADARADYEWAHDAWKELAYLWFGPTVNVEYGGSLQMRMVAFVKRAGVSNEKTRAEERESIARHVDNADEDLPKHMLAAEIRARGEK